MAGVEVVMIELCLGCFVVLGIIAVPWADRRLRLRRVRQALERFRFADIVSARGQVAVQGRVVANKSIRSMVGRRRCVAYRCKIWWYDDDSEDDPPSLHLLADVTRAAPFRLRDDSGWALVRPNAPRLLAILGASPAQVPAKRVPRVRRLLRKRHADGCKRPPWLTRLLPPAEFEDRDDRLRFEEHCIVDGDRAVVLGKGHTVQSSRVAELGTPMNYRSAPQATRIAPATGDSGVWIAGGTHAALMKDLQTGNHRFWELTGV